MRVNDELWNFLEAEATKQCFVALGVACVAAEEELKLKLKKKIERKDGKRLVMKHIGPHKAAKADLTTSPCQFFTSL